MNTNKITKEIHITGSVQGVGFRPFIVRLAFIHKITGTVQNRGNYVKIIIQGDMDSVNKFVHDIKDKKPPLSVIQTIDVIKLENKFVFTDFSIVQSAIDNEKKTTSYIPPDITICDQCLDDMLKGDRIERKNYPFTSCVDCGPRYSVIKGLPYDRPLTTMNVFQLCKACEKEYKNPLDRRFHAQTTCCRTCGPSYSLYDKNGKKIPIEDSDLITEAKRILLNNKILAIKGIGGTHLATNTYNSSVIEKLRSMKGDRKKKPFAVMSYSLDSIATFAQIPNENYIDMLQSPRRPIVLLPKIDNFPLVESIAPQLHNIGVMMPYTGLHYLILQESDLQTIVLTSANLSHLPIQKDNSEIFSSLFDVADYFLLHNREIHQRNDDSVVKILQIGNQTKNAFIRRSRGFTPEPINCNGYNKNKIIIGLGSELHTTPALITQNKVFMTQYIGNLRYEPTFKYYKEAIMHIHGLLQEPEIEAVAHDLHPQLLSTEFAKELHKEKNIPIYPFQHHYAHAASLLLDNNKLEEDAIIVTADGLGYGEDGNIWGGEVFYINQIEKKRLSHIDYVHQPGGDIATKFPLRMLISNLKQSGLQSEEIIRFITKYYGTIITNQELMIVINQLDKKINTPLTSSTGRFLDACSVALGLCNEATYEGEPAIILESIALQNNRPSGPNPFLNLLEKNSPRLNFNLAILELVNQIEKNLPKEKLAYWIQEFVGKSFAVNAIHHADEQKVSNIGFTGGVAYNEIIINSFVEVIEKYNPKIETLLHTAIPPGDGGIGAGQAVLLAKKLL
jgi:hydrogenase maturation protein HypF